MCKKNYQKIKGERMPTFIFGNKSQYLWSPLSTAMCIFNIFFLSFRQQKIESGHTVNSDIYKTWSTIIHGMFRI